MSSSSSSSSSSKAVAVPLSQKEDDERIQQQQQQQQQQQERSRSRQSPSSVLSVSLSSWRGTSNGMISFLFVIAIVLGVLIQTHFIYLEPALMEWTSHNNNDRSSSTNDDGSDMIYRQSHASSTSNKNVTKVIRNKSSVDTGTKIISSFMIPTPHIPTRVFSTWENEFNNVSLPCVINYNESRRQFSLKVQDSASNTGLLFIKIEKAGSSTLAGIVGRMAEIIYKRQSTEGVGGDGGGHSSIGSNITTSGSKNNITLIDEDGNSVLPLPRRGHTQACKCRGMSHKWGFHSQKRLFPPSKGKNQPLVIDPQQQRRKRFLWSVVRHPEKRLISQYFHFKVSRLNSSTADEDIIEYLKAEKYHNRQMQYLYPFPRQVLTINKYDDIEKRISTYQSLINHVLRTYNFIGTLERLDETLVLLHFIMGIKLTDVIPLSAKRSGRHEELDMNGNGQCNTYKKSFVSDGVQAFMNSYDKFRRYHEADYMIYDAINQSMDMTIESIGQEKFYIALKEFRKLKTYARQRNCTYVNPCLREGVLRTWRELNQLCYLGDAGCGHKCLDKLFPE